MQSSKNSRSLTRIALKKAKKEFIFRSIFAFISRGLLMAIPVLFGLAVGFISDGDFKNAYFMAGMLIIVFICFRLSDIANTYFWHKLFNKLYQELTNVGLQNTHDNSLFSLSRIDTGEYLNIMHNDLTTIGDFYCWLPVRIIRVFEFIIIIIFFFFSNVLFGVAGVIVSIISFIILYISSKRIENLNNKRAKALDRRNGILNETLLCIKEIKAFNIFSRIKSRAMKSSNDFASIWLNQRVTEDAYRFGIVLLIEIFRLALFIYGIYLISNGHMEVGVLIVIYNYYGQLIDNFFDFGTINISYRNLLVSESRFNKILEYSNNQTNKNKLHVETEGNISFKNVLYGYRHAPTLNNVSFEINSREITCIVGEADSGKKGIIDLLLKLNRQHSGEVLLDKTDINDFNYNDYLSTIALTSDESTLFNMSIKDNLNIVGSDFNEAVSVCKALDIHEYIIKLKDGYDTILSSNGANIDVNIRLLLSVARALIKNSKILIFDEVFSLLSKKCVTNIMNILKDEKQDHTIIIFTKDSSILEQSNKVIVFDHAEVAALGSHEELLKNDELYHDLIGQ